MRIDAFSLGSDTVETAAVRGNGDLPASTQVDEDRSWQRRSLRWYGQLGDVWRIAARFARQHPAQGQNLPAPEDARKKVKPVATFRTRTDALYAAVLDGVGNRRPVQGC